MDVYKLKHALVVEVLNALTDAAQDGHLDSKIAAARLLAELGRLEDRNDLNQRKNQTYARMKNATTAEERAYWYEQYQKLKAEEPLA